MTKRTRLFASFLLAIPLLSFSQNNPATVREYTKTFVTYPFSDPNPVPVVGLIYPYYRFDMFTDKPSNKEWKVVELENDYLKVMILPEIGGKIWAAIEKSTGKSFIYYNHVVKFRDIAMRGPWTSGGIEPNYGIIGHTPNCATPVDYVTMKNDDGSVSCVIGVLDLLTRTPWRVEINLPKDKAYFTTTSFWFNATPLEQPYYTWMNAGIRAKGNLQLIYPGTHYLGHGGEFKEWNINKENGKDISFYENNNFGGPKSYHVFGTYADFYGAYWHDDDFGMGRYAAHDEKPGKKIWIWGLSQQGMIWEKLLTDDDGQYVEVQSGRLFNQTAGSSTFTPFKHREFAPFATDRWTEYWFPVKETKGYVKANPHGALNVRRDSGNVKIAFSPLQYINDTLTVFDNDRIVYSKLLRLRPMETFADEVHQDVTPERLRVTLGGDKLIYNADPNVDTLARPLETPKDFDWNSVYGLYIQGKEYARQRLYAEAREKLDACLQKDRNYLPALTEMVMLLYRDMEYVEALDYARRALSIDTYDGGANYYYGLANLKLGKVTDAKDGFDIASASVEYRDAAYTELSRVYLKEKNLERAIHYAGKSLEFNSGNLEALQVLAIVYRMQNNREKATEILGKLLSLDPLNHFARCEKYLWTEQESDRNAFTAFVRNEMPDETFLELAIWYYEVDCLRECEKVLALDVKNPEMLYWRAFVLNKLHDPSYAIHVENADNASPDLVFPFRPETAEVLRWVIENDDHWQPKYYLGLIYWSVNNIEKTKQLLSQCGTAPGYAPFYAARAEVFKGEEQYLLDLRHAAKLDGKEWRYGRMLANYSIERKHFDEALKIAERYYGMSPDNYIMGMLYAKALLLNGKYEQCVRLLGKLDILPYEGATDGRLLYRESKLMLALQRMKSKSFREALHEVDDARLWPENLGVGKPYPDDVDERLEDWLALKCYGWQNATRESDSLLKKIISTGSKGYGTGTLISAWALQRAGRQTDAENLFKEWRAGEPESGLAKWCQSVFKGEGEKVPEGISGDESFRVLKELLSNHIQ